MRERINTVDGVFGEAAVGAETVRPMPLRAKAVIQARGVHPLAATLAAAAPGMNLDGDPVADLTFVDRRTELHDRSHVFVARCEAAVERQAAIDHCRHAVPDDLDVGRAYRDRVDPYEHLGRPWFRHRLLDQRELLRATQYPRFHPV